MAFLIGAVLIVVVTTLNIFTELHDDPEVAWWEPVVWEYSSAVASIALLVIPWRAYRLATPGEAPWPRLLLVHVLASVLFCAAHVGVFVALRYGAYAALGERYAFAFTLSEFLYEYRKDLIGYGLGVAALWLVPRALAHGGPGTARVAQTEPPSPSLYAIREGARTLRVDPGEIVAATSAGNYVEFTLLDGRRPLARATLAGVEAELAPHGFVRTHRSWLVNAARVRSLTPEGSGDHALELDGGLQAPLSRRYPEALARLRRP